MWAELSPLEEGITALTLFAVLMLGYGACHILGEEKLRRIREAHARELEALRQATPKASELDATSVKPVKAWNPPW